MYVSHDRYLWYIPEYLAKDSRLFRLNQQTKGLSGVINHILCHHKYDFTRPQCAHWIIWWNTTQMKSCLYFYPVFISHSYKVTIYSGSTIYDIVTCTTNPQNNQIRICLNPLIALIIANKLMGNWNSWYRSPHQTALQCKWVLHYDQ